MISYLLILSLLAPPSPPTGSPEARGERAYEDERYAEAAEAFGEAYAKSGDPKHLFAQAQAERIAGNCRAALNHYDEFLRSDPGRKSREDAELGSEECLEALKARGETWLAPIANPEPGPPPAPEEVEPEDDEPEEVEPDPEPKDRAQWPRDKLAIGLVVGGALVGGVGLALIGAGVRLDRGAGDAPTERTFETDIDRSVRIHGAGIGIAAVGGAVLLGGVIRWAVVAKRERESKVALHPTLRGVVVTGRF